MTSEMVGTSSVKSIDASPTVGIDASRRTGSLCQVGVTRWGVSSLVRMMVHVTKNATTPQPTCNPI